MLHEAELQLRKLAKESKVISEGQGALLAQKGFGFRV